MQFVRTNRYLKDIRRIGASSNEMSTLEGTIVADPEAGKVIRGLGGVRKIRFGIGNRGKSGGGRAIYFLMLADDIAVMLTAYAKSEKEELSPQDRKAILNALKELADDR